MVRFLTLLACCVAPLVRVHAQGPIMLPKHVLDSIAQSRVAKSELLHFDALHIDLGGISDDGVIKECEFNFINDRFDTVKIDRITTSCGCLTFMLSDKVVAPGSRGKLIARYNPTDHIGPFEQRINLYSYGSSTPMTVLKVTGFVIDDAAVPGYPFNMGGLRLSAKSISFGNVTNVRTKSITISCVNKGTVPVKLKTYSQMAPKWIQFRTQPEIIQAGAEAEIEITIITDQIPERCYGSQCLNLILDGIEARPSERSLQLQYVYKEKML